MKALRKRALVKATGGKFFVKRVSQQQSWGEVITSNHYFCKFGDGLIVDLGALRDEYYPSAYRNRVILELIHTKENRLEAKSFVFGEY